MLTTPDVADSKIIKLKWRLSFHSSFKVLEKKIVNCRHFYFLI